MIYISILWLFMVAGLIAIYIVKNWNFFKKHILPPLVFSVLVIGTIVFGMYVILYITTGGNVR